jgi:hypothetical protein
MAGEEDFTRENVKSFTFHLATENALPLDVSIQAYLMDGNDDRIDSLFNEQNREILPSAVIDEDGKVIMATFNEVDVPLTDTQMDHVFLTEWVMIRVFMETTDQGTRDIKFYSTNYLRFQLGAMAEVSFTSEDND